MLNTQNPDDGPEGFPLNFARAINATAWNVTVGDLWH